MDPAPRTEHRACVVAEDISAAEAERVKRGIPRDPLATADREVGILVARGVDQDDAEDDVYLRTAAGVRPLPDIKEGNP